MAKERQGHQPFVVVVVTDLQRMPFHAILLEACMLVEPDSSDVGCNDREPDFLDGLQGIIKHLRYQGWSKPCSPGLRPDEHPPENALVPLLGAVRDGEAYDAHQVRRLGRSPADYDISVQPVCEPIQGLSGFFLPGSAERLRVCAKAAETQIAIADCIRCGEATDLEG